MIVDGLTKSDDKPHSRPTFEEERAYSLEAAQGHIHPDTVNRGCVLDMSRGGETRCERITRE